MNNNIKKLIRDSDYIKILIPFVISTMTQPLLGAVDTAVAGRLGNPAYIAGVSVGSVVFNTIYWVFGFLRVNTTSFSSMALGTGKTEDRAFAFFQPLYIALFISFIILIFQKIISFYAEKIHSRANFKWIHPRHLIYTIKYLYGEHHFYCLIM